jgi:RNA polymerase sigma factor (sigma-70 family)
VTQKYKAKDKQSYSLDQSIGSIDSSTGYDLVSQSSDKDPLQQLIEKEEKQEVLVNIKKLLEMADISEKQKKQLTMYYFDKQTLSQIGNHFGVSREAIRQSIKRALEIIRNYDKSYA